MPQANIIMTYDPFRQKWAAFLKFDFAIADEKGGPIQFALSEAPTFGDALDTLKSVPMVQRYFQLLKDSIEGAEQNAAIN